MSNTNEYYRQPFHTRSNDEIALSNAAILEE